MWAKRPTGMQDFLVNLDNPHNGWLISILYTYKSTGSRKQRSCVNCRASKARCDGITNDSKTCTKCHAANLTCVFSLTDVERDKLERLQNEGKTPDEARIQLGLARSLEEYLEINIGKPSGDLKSPEGPPLPSFGVLAQLVDLFIRDDNVQWQLANAWILDRLWTKEPCIVWCAALLATFGSTPKQQIPTSHEDTQAMRNALFYHIQLACKSMPFGWIKMLALEMLWISMVNSGTENLDSLTNQVVEVGLDMYRLKPFWTKQLEPSVDPAWWLEVECIRRSFVITSLDQPQGHHGRVYPSIAWNIVKKVPLMCEDDSLYWKIREGDPLPTSLKEFQLSSEEWKHHNLEWLGLPRNHPVRETCLKRVGNLKQYGIFNFTALCIQILIRACRGVPSLWPGYDANPILPEDLGPGFVAWTEFQSWQHWSGILDDVWRCLPTEIVHADWHGRGDRLVQLARHWFGLEKFQTRLLVSILYLHEARIGAFMRRMRVPRVFSDDECLVDMLLSGTSSESDMLVELLGETIRYLRLVDSSLNLNVQYPLAIAVPMMRLGYINLAILRRLHRTNVASDVIPETENDARVVYTFMMQYGQVPFVQRIAEVYLRHLQRPEEVKVGVARGMVGGFGFLWPRHVPDSYESGCQV
jgi:hypothetical protein